MSELLLVALPQPGFCSPVTREPARSLGNLLERGIDFDQIEGASIERYVSDPTDVVLVFFVVAIGQSFKEVFIAAGSADVLGRTSVLAFYAEGEPEGVNGQELAFDGDGVPPTVPEVVFIEELLVTSQCLKHGDLVLINLTFWVVVKAHSIALVANFEGVQVRIRPAHGGLKNVVQLGHADTGWHEDPPPDAGGDIVQGNVQLERGLRWMDWHVVSK